MADSDILIQGAREHNLRDVRLVLPRNRLICFTGVSGSGKSSLAFDTLYAEGQRRYVESLSSFARQFLGQMPKPDVDLISGLSPSISISQKSAGQNPRSTVGTITEIYDYLRVLYARVGKGHCPQCGRPITAQTREQIIDRIAALPAGTPFLVLAPLIRGQKGEYRDLFDDLLKQGFVRRRVDGRVVHLTDDLRLDRQMRHNIEVVIDRLVAGPKIRPRLAEAVELALQLGEGNLIVAMEDGAEGGSGSGGRARRPARLGRRKTRRRRGRPVPFRLPPSAFRLPPSSLSAHYACTHCQLSFEPPSPQLFSFNSPQGMCPECSGLGQIYTFDPERLVPDPSRSFQQGCIELFGPLAGDGPLAAAHLPRRGRVPRAQARPASRARVLETAWEELDPGASARPCSGAPATSTSRSPGGAGPSGYKWGGKFEGIIPKLLSQYRTTRSRLAAPATGKVHARPRLRPLRRPAAQCPGRGGDAHHAPSPAFGDRPERSLAASCRGLPFADAEEFLGALDLDATGQTIAAEALKEIRGRLRFLKNVGLDYLTLDRTAPTLSGGEMQRIRLAGQIGCGLVGVLYILDEPSIGLHPRDNDKLLETLAQLRDQGNTVIVVEHDEDTMRAADHLVDFGPGPGVRGGQVVAAGPLAEVARRSRRASPGSISPAAADRGPRRPPPGRTAERLVVRGAPAQQPQEYRRGNPAGRCSSA